MMPMLPGNANTIYLSIREQYEECGNGSLLFDTCPQSTTPQCDPDTGDYTPLQCREDSCYCTSTESGKVRAF